MNGSSVLKKARFCTVLLTSTALLASCAGYGGGPTAASSAAMSGQAKPISDKERQTGTEAHAEITQEFGGSYNSSQTAYVQKIGKNIATYSGLGANENAFTVTYLNSAVNNAFAIPGGYIYITRQLTALCNDEAEMAGVLAHEIGHVAARHSQQRQKAAQNYGIAGIVGTVLGSVLGGSGGIAGALGGLLKDYSGTAAQLATLGYSRGQEEEADDLGILYLSKAGYDPKALSSMLYSLALQTSLEASMRGQDARSMPEWASTHPDPAKRVNRAASNAAQYPAGSKRNRDVYLSTMDGLLYGDDPQQGVIEGNSFLYPPERLKFSVPSGFTMQNGSTLSISGTGGQGQFAGGTSSDSLSAYISKVFKALGAGDTAQGATTTTTINGIPAAYSVTRVTTQSGEVDVTIVAYKWDSNSIYHFLTLAPAGQTPFNSMFQSVSRMTAAEAAAVKPRKLDIVTVRSGDTVTSLSSRMAFTDYKTERFMALNGLNSSSSLQAGQKVKIVTY